MLEKEWHFYGEKKDMKWKQEKWEIKGDSKGIGKNLGSHTSSYDYDTFYRMTKFIPVLK